MYCNIHIAYLYLFMHGTAGVPWETTSQATSEQHPKNVWMHIYHIKQNGVSLVCQCWFKRPGCHCRIHAVTQSSIIFQISWYFTCIYVVGLICDPVSILCVWQLFKLGHRNTVEVNAPMVTALWDQRFEMGLLLQLRWASPVRKKSFEKKRSHCRWCWVGACNPQTTSGSYVLHVCFFFGKASLY